MVSTGLPTQASIQTALKPYLEDRLPTIVIESAESYEQAGALLKDVTRKRKEIEEAEKTFTRPVDELKKTYKALFAPALARYANVEAELRQGITDYTRRLEADRRRLEAELRDAQREAERSAAELARTLEAQGKPEQAAAAVALAAAPIPVVHADLPKVSGLSLRDTWKGEVTNMDEFLLYIVEHDMYHLIQVNQSALDTLARQTKGIRKVPGIKFSNNPTTVVRT